MNAPDTKQRQLQRMRADPGFVAALDQSGGSTPKALAAYGIPGGWADEAGMFALVHRMRARILASPSFTGERILGAILFEDTMDRDVEGRPAAHYLWDVKRIVPFLKVDQGLAEEKDGVRLMRPMPALPALLAKARAKRIFGTKTRSLIKQAHRDGIRAVVAQQFEVAAQILGAGLVPILEPEVDIDCPDKAAAERLLKDALLGKLGTLPDEPSVFLKLTLPEQDDLYLDCAEHRSVARVLALSGGYSRQEGNDRLRRNHRVIASFSRALLDGLAAQQPDPEFDSLLGASIESIFEASVVKAGKAPARGGPGD